MRVTIGVRGSSGPEVTIGQECLELSPEGGLTAGQAADLMRRAMAEAGYPTSSVRVVLWYGSERHPADAEWSYKGKRDGCSAATVKLRRRGA